MNIKNECKYWYEAELEHTDKLNGKLSTHLSFLTLLGSANILLLNNLLKFVNKSVFKVNLTCCIICIICFCFSLVFFIMAYHNYKIGYINIRDNALFIQQIIKLKNLEEIKKEKYFEEAINQQYINAAIKNREQNVKKANTQRKFIYILTFSFVIVGLVFLINIGELCYFKYEAPPQKQQSFYLNKKGVTTNDK